MPLTDEHKAGGLRFDSRDDALSFAKRTVEDAQRWFAAECPAAYGRLQAEQARAARRPLRSLKALLGLIGPR